MVIIAIIEIQYVDLFCHLCFFTCLSISSSSFYLIDLSSSPTFLSIPSFLPSFIIIDIFVYYLYMLNIEKLRNLDCFACYYCCAYFVSIVVYR